MNPYSVVADSDESAVVGPEDNSTQASASSCKVIPPFEPSPAQITGHPDERDESDKCLTVERPASDLGQVSAIVIRSAARARAPAEASANTTTAVAQERAEAAWPLTLDQIIKQTLIRLLRETAGNRRRTASLLGISRSTLYRMLARYGIDHVGRATTSRKPGVDPSLLSA
jgi:DNA-binding NtrC family response regulator